MLKSLKEPMRVTFKDFILEVIMFYISTRNKENKVKASEAIATGISPEGGLFVPESIPAISLTDIEKLKDKSYWARAEKIMSMFLDDFTAEELSSCVRGAYDHEGFDCEEKAPISKLSSNMYVLELWHGPTCAFKDMALQILPRLMTVAAKKTGVEKDIVILVATSGDTGKAALEGFKDVEGTKMIVFYPEEGVSKMQKLQMATQLGDNLSVVAIKGNFDNAQSGVKEIFTSSEIKEKLSANHMQFSSANSINWGRLLPQIVYYFSSYAQLVKDEEIAMGDTVNVVVPTGNFGNILAAYYGKQMGLPLGKLICGSNENNVLTDFLQTGTYDKNRDFHATNSPSMDILLSSNLERLLFEIVGRDDKELAGLMDQLGKDGRYSVTPQQLEKIKEDFYGGYCNEQETLDTIKNIYEEYSYLTDTHTAVAIKVYEDYVANTGDNTKTIIASTASPYKFPVSVSKALGDNIEDDFTAAYKLDETSGMPMPQSLKSLEGKEVRFNTIIDSKDMLKEVMTILNIK